MEAAVANALRHFVRDGLGCTCPDEVLRRIEVERSPAAFADLEPAARLLKVGRRLLVLVVPCPDPQRTSQELGEWFARGRALRDAEGWNRFRLVAVTAEPAPARPCLERALAGLGLDDRLHLHLIAPQDLPDF